MHRDQAVMESNRYFVRRKSALACRCSHKPVVRI